MRGKKTVQKVNRVDERGMLSLFRTILETYPGYEVDVYLEHAQSMPRQGVVAMFRYGYVFGTTATSLYSVGWEPVLINAATWKAGMGLTKATPEEAKARKEANPNGRIKVTKEPSMRLCCKLYPASAAVVYSNVRADTGERQRKALDGRAEAILIAHYGRHVYVRPEDRPVKRQRGPNKIHQEGVSKTSHKAKPKAKEISTSALPEVYVNVDPEMFA